jgi:hypothetical protein
MESHTPPFLSVGKGNKKNQDKKILFAWLQKIRAHPFHPLHLCAMAHG